MIFKFIKCLLGFHNYSIVDKHTYSGVSSNKLCIVFKCNNCNKITTRYYE